MTITKEIKDNSVTLKVEGRLDTLTTPELEKEIQALQDKEEMIMDFSALDYISSAGLRVLLSTHKSFAKKAGLTILNAKDEVIDIFEVTGFNDILNIK